MAQYVKVVRSIWTNPGFIALSSHAQRLYFLLISQPDISHAGVLPLLERRWARLSASTSTEDVLRDLEELRVADFVQVDEQTDEVLVRSYIRYDEMHKVPNGNKAVVKAIDSVISSTLRCVAFECLHSAETEGSTDAAPKGSDKGSPKGSDKGYATPASKHSSKHMHMHNNNPSSSSEPLELSEVAERAVDIYLSHRIETGDISAPGAWMRKVRPEVVAEHHDALTTSADAAKAYQLASSVFGISVTQARSAEHALTRRERT